MEGKAFQYSSLPTKTSIRLLKVFINKYDGQLSFELRDYLFSTAPYYHAMSYAWGESLEKKTIICNGRAMKVGKPVYDALHNMYAPSIQRPNRRSSVKLSFDAPLETEIPIWIDAICINQQDEEEKGHQVHRMREIYKNAKCVLVWLGLEENESDLAIESIPDLAPKLKLVPYPILDEELGLYNLPDQKNAVWSALGHLFRRKWYGRLWVFQEVVLGREVLIVCARKTIEWDLFTSIAEDLNRLLLHGLCYNFEDMEIYETGIMSIVNMESMKRYRTEYGQTSFASLLTFSDTKLTSDPRDRVYGMLGLADESFRAEIPISYNDTGQEGVWRTYIDCAKACIRQESINPLYILEMVANRPRVPGLPSWCPNLMFSPGERFLFAGFHAGVSSHQLLQRSATKFPQLDILQTTGFRMDTVIQVVNDFSWPGREGESVESKNQRFLTWEAQCLELAQKAYFSSFETVPLGHLFTLTANTRAQISEAEDDDLLQAYLDQLLDSQQIAATGNNRWPPSDRLPRFHQFFEQMSQNCKGRQYFSTKGGRTGLGPPDMKVGDTVCVFYDAETLFLLRPEEGEMGEGWFLVGDAYVYGLMDLDETLKGERGEDEVFTIY